MSDRDPAWLNRQIVDAIHAAQIKQHGGAFGVRDEGLIESALARPRHLWAYERPVVDRGTDDQAPDLPALAAAYGFGLCRNHGYVDGNKRVAFLAMFVFLALNGHELDAPEPEVVAVMLALAAGEMSEAALADWIRDNVEG